MVTAISMVRDEADIVEPVVRHMASQVDSLIVADNRSVDGTREILERLAAELPLTVLDEPREGYYQSRIVTRLARRAAERGAEWVVPFDADEWFASPQARIADLLAGRTEDILMCPSYEHVPTSADDPAEPDPIKRIAWRQRDREKWPKVICRGLPGLTIEQGSHSARCEGREAVRGVGPFTIRHFKWRSPEQFERKVRNGAAAIAATDLDDRVCNHWRSYGQVLAEGGSEALRRVFHERHFREDPSRPTIVSGVQVQGLVFDPARSGADGVRG